MSVRRAIVAIDPATVNVRKFCASHGISTYSFYARRRYAAEGEAGLEPRSRAPQRRPGRTSVAVEGRVSPRSVEASRMRSGDARDTSEVRPRVP